MVVINLTGGLGNQMFQFAIAKIMAKKNRTQVLLDLSFFEDIKGRKDITLREFELDVFDNLYRVVTDNIAEQFKNPKRIHKIKRSLNLRYPKVYRESNFMFHPELLKIKPPVYLIGYFQSYKYLKSHENFIRSLFVFPEDKIGEQNLKLLNFLEKNITTAVHIRRGDYILNPEIERIHGVCSLDEYYNKAIERIRNINENITFVFFSDDIEWVREKFSHKELKKIFVTHNRKKDSWVDLFLMSKCSNNIIANSSFSWWGAWLNKNRDKTVIAPKRWFKEDLLNSQDKDLIPPQWIRM